MTGDGARGLTLAARVLGGFLLVLATFAAVSAYGVYKLDRFQNDLSLVADTYVRLRDEITRLQSEHGELALATAVSLPPTLAHLLRDVRGQELADIQAAQQTAAEALAAPLPAADEAFLNDVAARMAALRSSCVGSSSLLEAALDAPGAGAAASALDEAFRSQKAAIQRLDALLHGRIGESVHRVRSEEIATLRRASVLAVLVLAFGFGIALSAHLALRRLGRLAASAREIAHGDYRQRVEEDGPGDVAALAREFNAMAGALEERELQLIRSERLAAVGRIAAQITHEVRNPLSSIGLNAELLEEEVGRLDGRGSPAVDEARSLCRAITKEVDRLATITEEYLRLARLPRPRLEREELNPLVGSLLDFLRGELTAAGIRVQTRLASDLPAVAADENQLRQALLNLLRNAREAMAGGGTLTVETGRTAQLARGRQGESEVTGSVEIVIADTGPGIPASDLARIFEPFFSTKDGGTGLGLPLTQQIVAEHGGEVLVVSEPERGTTFTVRLPALAASATLFSEESARSAARRS